ncbi:MAG: flagellar basal body P-ring protein FlgI [Candidatus Manganitrophaceae bacterium]
MRGENSKRIQIGLVLLIGTLFSAIPIDAEAVRIKDVVTVEGVRENSLIGYGLVIGLSGTGDKTGTTFTVQTLSSMLKKMGITVDPSAIKVKNVAAVMVTAKLPPFFKAGSRIDVVVSSLGDAASLQGGTLLLTPLKAPDQEVYAVAQGPISIGGFVGGKEGDSVQKNHPTAGRIANGALVEKEGAVSFTNKDQLNLLLRQQDFTTALRISQVINTHLAERLGVEGTAIAVDSGTVSIPVPEIYRDRIVALLSEIEAMDVQIDLPARVVVNERTGTIVMGDQVKISDVAVSHGNLTIRVKTEFQVSQPPAFAPEGSKTVIVPKQQTDIQEQNAQILVLKGGTTIGEVVRGLNAIGVTPRDLIAILQAIKAAGALQAELEIL